MYTALGLMFSRLGICSKDGPAAVPDPYALSERDWTALHFMRCCSVHGSAWQTLSMAEARISERCLMVRLAWLQDHLAGGTKGGMWRPQRMPQETVGMYQWGYNQVQWLSAQQQAARQTAADMLVQHRNT